MMQLVTFGVVAVAAGAYYFWMNKKAGAFTANLLPNTITFMQQTGYRMPTLPLDAPVEAHAQASVESVKGWMAARAAGHESRMVKLMDGLPIELSTFYGYRDGNMQTYVMSAGWTARLAAPSRLRWHVADKRIGGLGEKGMELVSSGRRVWQPAFPYQVAIGDPELDARFKFFVEHPAMIAEVARIPGLRDLLLGCAEVDLRVLPDAVVFSDPLQKNLQAGMGGALGAMAAGYDFSKLMMASIPVHLRVCDLVYLAARYSR